jgi:hypothetical protein
MICEIIRWLDTVGNGRMTHRENTVLIGGILNKQQMIICVSMYKPIWCGLEKIWENSNIRKCANGIYISGKRTELEAEAYIKNLKPKFLEENYQSK